MKMKSLWCLLALLLTPIVYASPTIIPNLFAYSSVKPAVTITIPNPEPEIVFPARAYPCNNYKSFPDNQARAFVDSQNKVHLLDNNSLGYYQMIGDSLNGPFQVDCSPIVKSVANGYDQQVSTYKNYVWPMSSWATDDGKVMLLVHSEFHGNAFGLPGPYCSLPYIKLPQCQYWNIVAAQSVDDGKTFQWVPYSNSGTTNQPVLNSAQPVIASPYKYDATNTNGQGALAQTNIVEDPNNPNDYYLLVESYVPNASTTNICLFRSNNPTDPLSWRGWDGQNFTVAMNQNPYKTTITNPQNCTSIASLPLRGINVDSLTYHTPSKQFILTATTAGWPSQSNNKEAFIYFTSPDLINWSQPGLIMLINWWDHWFNSNCSIYGQAYSSLLDPNSQRKNFDYIGTTPYLYYTQLDPGHGGCGSYNNTNARSLVRVPLQISENIDK